MKKFALPLTVIGIALIPTLIFSQPPRPHVQPPRPQIHPQIAQPTQVSRPTMQVHVPATPPPMYGQRVVVNRPPAVAFPAPYFQPPLHPQVAPPRVVVVPQVIAPPPVIAPAVVLPGYYPQVNNGFSLTIGGTNGFFSISTAR